MKKLIKNYTTEVSVEKTIAEIEKMLVDNGATGIAKDYKDGKINAVFFKITYNGNTLPFRLPAKTTNAYAALYADKKYSWSRAEEQKARDMEQAERVAWRATKAWVEAQITFVNLDQAKIAEVFFPYFVTGDNQTLFDQLSKNNFLLPEGRL